MMEPVGGSGGAGDGDPFATLDDESLAAERELTMAELKARVAVEAAVGGVARKVARDDELLEEIPDSDHHLGRFAGWRASRRPRLFVGVGLGVAVLAGVIAFYIHTRDMKHDRLHPLPEVEATIAPGTPRDMTIADGQMRVELSREAPSINVLHLPDRDVELARGVEKSQFKVEVRGGRTVRIKVLTGGVVERLKDGAEPLL